MKFIFRLMGLPTKALKFKAAISHRNSTHPIIDWKFEGKPKSPHCSDWWQFTLWIMAWPGKSVRFQWRHNRTRKAIQPIKTC